jgi:RNA polymerase sigma-70 factor (ECF subfamily)
VSDGNRYLTVGWPAEVESDVNRPPTGDAVRLAAAFVSLAAGDLEALAVVYDACADDLFGLALWRTGSREDAADAVQEVFVRLARRPDRIAKVRNVRAYLLAMAHSAAVDILRRRRKTVQAEDAILEPVTVDHEGSADAGRLSCLLLRLPTAQREAVWLRHFAELSFAEIGDATGVPVFTAASRYRLGMRRLRRLLGVKR